MAQDRIEVDTGTGELLCEIRDRVALITLSKKFFQFSVPLHQASSKAPATILHLTHAERAMANRERIAIHNSEAATRLPAIHKLFQVQVAPAKLA